MSTKQAKIIRKEFRRMVGGSMETLNKITRKRPWFFPKFVWVIFYLPLFRARHLKEVYKHMQ